MKTIKDDILIKEAQMAVPEIIELRTESEHINKSIENKSIEKTLKWFSMIYFEGLDDRISPIRITLTRNI